MEQRRAAGIRNKRGLSRGRRLGARRQKFMGDVVIRRARPRKVFRSTKQVVAKRAESTRYRPEPSTKLFYVEGSLNPTLHDPSGRS